MREIKLEWYVLNYDFNKKKIVNQNIFYNGTPDDLRKARRNKKFTNREELKEYLKKDFMYHYWSRAESEILVGGLFAKNDEDFEKIDVYRQLEMNLDQITDYVINKMKFVFNKKKAKKGE